MPIVAGSRLATQSTGCVKGKTCDLGLLKNAQVRRGFWLLNVGRPGLQRLSSVTAGRTRSRRGRVGRPTARQPGGHRPARHRWPAGPIAGASERVEQAGDRRSEDTGANTADSARGMPISARQPLPNATDRAASSRTFSRSWTTRGFRRGASAAHIPVPGLSYEWSRPLAADTRVGPDTLLHLASISSMRNGGQGRDRRPVLMFGGRPSKAGAPFPMRRPLLGLPWPLCLYRSSVAEGPTKSGGWPHA